MWTIEIADQTVVSRVMGVMVVRGRRVSSREKVPPNEFGV